MKIFDLNNPPKLGSNLQNSIKALHNQFGEKFTLKYNVEDKDIQIPINLFKKKSKFADGEFWSIKYSPDRREQWLLPLSIDFTDSKKVVGSSAYLANVTSTDSISGTTMVELALKLLKTVNAKKVYLHDGSRVYCGPDEIDLSLFKLIEKGETFYQRFGFRFSIDDSATMKFNFKSSKQLQEKMLEYIGKVKKIKVEYLINTYTAILDTVYKVIKNQDYDNVRIKLYHPSDPFDVPKEETREKTVGLVSEIDTILSLTKHSKHVFLYQEMLELFHTECNKYADIVKYIFDNQVYSVQYKEKKFVLKDMDIFFWIREMKHSVFVKEF